MKNIFNLVILTAGAICLAVFLSTLPGRDLVNLGSNRSIAAAARAPAHSCRFHGPLLASEGSLGVLRRA